jgi:hypothetical protein
VAHPSIDECLQHAPTKEGSSLSIECVDARNYRNQIIELFESSGHLEFGAQFDWYYRERGQESPTTWLLRNRKSEICGLCSVTLRNLWYGNETLRAGVAGNLLVSRNSGIYHGAFALVRAMKSMVTSRQIDVLLGIPNDASRSIFERLGFQTIGRWVTHARITRSGALLRAQSEFPALLAAPVVDAYARVRRVLSAGERFRTPEFQVRELPEQELSCLLLKGWQHSARIALHSTSEYLKGRFLDHPGKHFRIYVLYAGDAEACAYCVARTSRGRAWIIEADADRRRISEDQAVRVFCRKLSHDAGTVWVTNLLSDPLCRSLSSAGLMTIPPSLGGYPDYPLIGFWRPEHAFANAFCQTDSWHLFPGFNDV